MKPRRRIVILGGGIGALSTAMHLTDTPGWQEQYEVTIYSLGWRLGGKAASSRNRAQADRVEEHGLHLWFGCYENAFAMLRRAYRERQASRTEPQPTIEDAFQPRDLMAMMEEHQGQWLRWPLRFPTKPGQPGVGARRFRGWRIAHYALSGLCHPVACLLGALRRAGDSPPTGAEPVRRRGRSWHPLAGALALARLALRALRLPESARGTTLRRAAQITEFALSVAIGALRDRLLLRGLRSIDGEEFRAWLARHGAHPRLLESTLVRSIYTAGFFFDHGEVDRPNLAAGCAIGLYMRIGLLYRGHVCYAMRGGMGEVVITPLYEVLRQRGVRFEFFSRVRRLELSADGERLERVHIRRQARPRDPQAGYQPLINIPGLPYACWPTEPLWDQLENGAALQAAGQDLEGPEAPPQSAPDDYALELGAQDRVVLAISLGALGPPAAELVQSKPAWSRLLRELPTVATQSVQLWTRRNATELGWPDARGTVVSTPDALCVWADMSHVLQSEHWPAGAAPRGLHYLCGPMPDIAAETADPVEEVAQYFTRWRARHGHWLWPTAATGGAAEAADEDTDGGTGTPTAATPGAGVTARTYLRANVHDSDRYVCSPAGGNLARLAAGDSGLTNMVLAGDWIETPINAGNVEAATVSGMLASRLLSGCPAAIVGEHILRG